MKIVINRCFGGFSLSNQAMKEIYKRKGKELFFYEGFEKLTKTSIDNDGILAKAFTKDFGDSFTLTDKIYEDYWVYDGDLQRNDPDLVAVVEQLGDKANGACSQLKVVEIPDGILYEITDYDGMERVEEMHRSWS